MKNVQFEDATETKIVAYFASPQSPSDYSNLGTVSDTDQRYLDFLHPPKTLTQKAMAQLAAGLAITSTGTPTLNGTYGCDSVSQADIVAIETSLNAGKGFPGGATTFGYPDMSGALHSFSQTEFTAFAAAVRDYVYALRSVISGQSTTLPASTASIA